MAEVLVLVDHVDGTVKKVTFELLTLAGRLGEPAAHPAEPSPPPPMLAGPSLPAGR